MLDHVIPLLFCKIHVLCSNSKHDHIKHSRIADGYIYSRIGTEYYEERLVDNDEPGLIPHYEYVLTNSTVQTTNLVHYNWGWDGSCDGYFAPGNGVASGNGYIFDGLQMITSIRLPRIDSNLNHDFL